MGKLIDKEEAIEVLGARPISWTDSDYELGRQNQYDEDMAAILDIPGIDLVRCKECKYYRSSHCTYIFQIHLQVPNDFYCGWAERRDDATD